MDDLGVPRFFGNTHRVQVSYIPVNIAGWNGWTLIEDVGILLNMGDISKGMFVYWTVAANTKPHRFSEQFVGRKKVASPTK